MPNGESELSPAASSIHAAVASAGGGSWLRILLATLLVEIEATPVQNWPQQADVSNLVAAIWEDDAELVDGVRTRIEESALSINPSAGVYESGPRELVVRVLLDPNGSVDTELVEAMMSESTRHLLDHRAPFELDFDKPGHIAAQLNEAEDRIEERRRSGPDAQAAAAIVVDLIHGASGRPGPAARGPVSEAASQIRALRSV